MGIPGVPELVIIGLICLGLVVVPLLVVLLVVFVWAKESGRGGTSAKLIPCPRCNHKVSPSASSCPSCGEPLAAAKPEP